MLRAYEARREGRSYRVVPHARVHADAWVNFHEMRTEHTGFHEFPCLLVRLVRSK